jgi:hypothetical protein
MGTPPTKKLFQRLPRRLRTSVDFRAVLAAVKKVSVVFAGHYHSFQRTCGLSLGASSRTKSITRAYALLLASVFFMAECKTHCGNISYFTLLDLIMKGGSEQIESTPCYEAI